MFDASPAHDDPPDPPHDGPLRGGPPGRTRPPGSWPDAEVDRDRAHRALDALLEARRSDPGAALAEAIEAWDAVQRAVDGALVEVLAGFDASLQWAADAHRSPVSSIVASTGLPARAAASIRRTCLDAAERPVLTEHARAGRLPLSHLRLLSSARCAPVEEIYDRDEEELAATACELTADGLRAHLARWRNDALVEARRNEPDGPEPPHSEGNSLRVSSLLDGRAALDADLTPQAAATIRAGLDAEYDRLRAAGALEADPRTRREIDGDLFVAIFERGMGRSEGAAPVPLVLATVDLDTLLTRAGVTAPAERTRRRAEIVGHGPVDDAVIGELIDRADLALLVTDPVTGHPLWYGRSRRLASAAQRQAVQATSTGHCDFPCCTVPLTRSQVDHLHEWSDGGVTDIDNLRPLCRFHNPLKHRRRIQVSIEPDGRTTYRTAEGAVIAPTYRHDP
jgi:hypothetical protein